MIFPNVRIAQRHVERGGVNRLKVIIFIFYLVGVLIGGAGVVEEVRC